MSKKPRRSPGRARKRRLEAAVQAIQQKWGTQALRQGVPVGNRRAVASNILSLPTGLSKLDAALSVGGLPLGHISELIGQLTSGKRTLALHILAQAQHGHVLAPAVYVDLAQTFDPGYAAACHVDLSQLAIAAPTGPVQALDLTCDLVAGGRFGLIIFDSTAELLTTTSGPGATVATLRRLQNLLRGKSTALLFLTTPNFGEPGSPHNYPAGFDLAQATALRLVVSRQRWLRRAGSIRGYEARVTVLRDRWGNEGNQATVQIAFNGVHVKEPGLL